MCDVGDLNSLHSTVSDIVFNNGSLNSAAFTVLDFCRFKALKRIVIGDGCCTNVNEVKMAELNELESVEIGMNSFTKEKYGSRYDPNRHFYLKNCPRLKSLKMGRYSFNKYSVCEIENVDALEVIEMGDVNSESDNFYYASLELKSILIQIE